MSLRVTIDISDDLHVELKRRAAAEHTSIRSLLTRTIEDRFRPRPSRSVTGPLVGEKDNLAADDRALWETTITDGWSILP